MNPENNKLKKIAFKFLLVTASVAFILVLIELSFTLFLKYPVFGQNKRFKTLMKFIYYEGYTRIPQWDPEFASYDRDLVYSLKPGRFVFSSNIYHVNSQGFRDDESSLTAPEIIVAGDSYAMGWGVEQDKTFADILEQKTKLKVLNMGIASYGTVREMMALNKADLSKLKYLIIDYQRNDMEENAALYKNDNSVAGIFMNKTEYEKEVKYYLESLKYYPGKYTLNFLKNYSIDYRTVELNIENIRENEMKYFLNALSNIARIDLSKIKLIILETPPRKDFAAELSSELMNGNYEQIRNCSIVDLYGIVGPKDFFILNGHLKPEGHKKVAEEIIKRLN